jgi:menaquinone-specific isochorismate synthase
LPDEHSLQQAASVEERLRITTLSVPVVPLDSVYRLWQQHASLLWHAPAGWQAVAAGVAAALTSDGPRRFSHLHRASVQLLRVLSPDCADAPAPRLWGGFAFAPGAADRAPWTGFGDASFVLARLTYWTDGEQAWLQGIGRTLDSTLAADLEAAEAAIAQIACGAGPTGRAASSPTSPSVRSIASTSATAWQHQVNGILDAIGTGEVRKVVGARCATVTFEQPLSIRRVLRNLQDEPGPVWRYAITRDGGTLVGATPELLVSRRGDAVRAEALAGTLAKSNGSEDDLMASTKDRNEHQFVCDAIVDTLAPLCNELHQPRTPTVRALRGLFHLATPIRGRLTQLTHVLDLCERLHPTPATCGTPRHRALRMILSTESAPRGWYAAPVGWFDAAGDGEFVVALRSGLVRGDTAYVYAGAGIVPGSCAEKELAETELKQLVMLRALGVSGM